MQYELKCGDSLDVLKEYPDNHFDSVVTDPPYLINFMNKKWDNKDALSVDIWKEIYRVLKPGGYLLSFSAVRTQHIITTQIEEAGFNIRDVILYMFGTGFPKSLDVSLAIDKQVAKVPHRSKSFEVEGLGDRKGEFENNGREHLPKYEPISDEAKEWQGWGSNLKPAYEPVVMAQKPILEKTIAANVLKWRTGGINIEACRAGDSGGAATIPGDRKNKTVSAYGDGLGVRGGSIEKLDSGRFPANFIHDGSDEVVSLFPKLNGESVTRFWYTSKASVKDREEGLENFEPKHTAAAEFRPNHMEKAENGEDGNPYGRYTKRKNIHNTVKPTDLMQYLCRLVTPPGGLVLDPFMGSGSTGKACAREGFQFVGIDMIREHVDIAEARIRYEINRVDKINEEKASENSLLDFLN